jgi:glycyl-tRNA synthetase beta subunit
MASDILAIIEELELKTADFYKKVKVVTRFKEFSETFSLMETVSLNHAKIIHEESAKYAKPNFDNNTIYKMHNHVTTLLWNEIINENNENVILDKISKAEENIGKLYKGIAKYFESLSVYYKEIGTFIDCISKEEFDHSKAITTLKNMPD